MACQAGLHTWEIDSISPSDVWIEIDGYNEREKGEWERARLMCFFMGNHKAKTPEKLMPFAWESENVNFRSNPREILEAHRKRLENAERK